MKVRALRMGLIYNRRMKPGTVFYLEKEEDYGSWMEVVEDSAVDMSANEVRQPTYVPPSKPPKQNPDFVEFYKGKKESFDPSKPPKKQTKKKSSKKAAPVSEVEDVI